MGWDCAPPRTRWDCTPLACRLLVPAFSGANFQKWGGVYNRYLAFNSAQRHAIS